MDDPAFATETDLDAQSILLASAHHDVDALRNLLRNSSANVQDAETGFTPLHAAILACERDGDHSETLDSSKATGENGVAAAENGQGKEDSATMQAAVKTLQLLFENGAIWNDLDANGETPGCIAHRLKLKELYGLCVDAGVRAELLLSRMEQYQMLGDDDSDEDMEEEEADEDEVVATAEVADADVDPDLESTQNPTYLASTLTFDRNKLVDAADNGVMMQWETTLMKRSAQLLVPNSGLRVLNVGHGMGIIDGFFQEAAPASHHIIEAHPDVLAKMKQQGWDKKPGVVIHEGRWQDVVPKLLENGDLFDAIYFDTFAEEYKALREFFSEIVVGLLDPAGGQNGEGGKFGFFNGMGADRQVCYDVYSRIVEMDLHGAGFDTVWESIAVPDLDGEGEWEGVKRKYWALDTYELPTCSFVS